MFNQDLTDVEVVKPPRYKEVMKNYFKTHKNKRDFEFLACCDWSVDNHVITIEDKEALIAIKQHRNEIAHELGKFLFTQKN